MTVKTVSVNTLEDVNPCPGNKCVWSGTTGGPKEIFRVWCGGVWAAEYGPDGAFLIGSGGGHASYDGNEAYAFSPFTGKWALHGTPAPYSGADTLPSGEYPDGSPASAHTYGMLGYMPPAWGGGTLGSLLRFGMPGGAVEQRVHAMDLASGKWRRFTQPPLPFGSTYGSAVRDDKRQGWWVCPSQGLVYFVSRQGAVNAQTGITYLNSNAQSMTCRIEARDILVNFDYAIGNVPKFTWLDCARPDQGWNAIKTTGVPPATYAWGFEYHQATNSIVSYQGTGEAALFALSVPADLSMTWEYVQVPLVGEAPSYVSGNPNGHFRRLISMPAGLLWVESGTGPVQAFK